MSNIKLTSLSVLLAVTAATTLILLRHGTQHDSRNKEAGPRSPQPSVIGQERMKKSAAQLEAVRAYNAAQQQAENDANGDRPIAAEAGYRKLLAMDPADKSPLLGIARSLRAQGRLKEAMTAYQVALHYA